MKTLWIRTLLCAVVPLGLLACKPAEETTATARQASQGAGPWEFAGFELEGANSLNPPLIEDPVYECTDIVTVRGAMAGAFVEVVEGDVMNGNVVGSATANSLGYAKVTLGSPASVNDKFSARQSFPSINLQSLFSFSRVPRAFVGELPTPEIHQDVWECGRRTNQRYAERGIPIQATLDGNPLFLFNSVPDSRNGLMHPVGHASLSGVGDKVVVFQELMCDGQSFTGLPSNPKEVGDEPSLTSPPLSVSVIEGTHTATVSGAFVGETQQWVDQGTTIFNGPVGFESFNFLFNSPPAHEFTSSSSVQVARSLCNSDEPVIAQATLDTLDPQQPEIVTPLCPGSDVVRVKGDTPGGRIVVTSKGVVLGQSTHDAGVTEVVVNSNGNVSPLSSGTQIQAHHVYPGGSQETVQEIVSVGASVLGVEGSRAFVDQNTNVSAQGFARDEGGPLFRLTQCCTETQQQSPVPSITGTIQLDGVDYSQVTLYRQYDGMYEGRWSFRTPSRVDENGSLTTALWPPTPNTNYTLVLDQTPCGSAMTSDPFSIVRTKPDLMDMTPPSVELVVNAGLAGSATASTTGSTNVTFTPINFVETLSLDLSSVTTDSNANLKDLTVNVTTGPGAPTSLGFKEALDNGEALPGVLELGGLMHDVLALDSPTTITATATKWSGATASVSVTIVPRGFQKFEFGGFDLSGTSCMKSGPPAAGDINVTSIVTDPSNPTGFDDKLVNASVRLSNGQDQTVTFAFASESGDGGVALSRDCKVLLLLSVAAETSYQFQASPMSNMADVRRFKVTSVIGVGDPNAPFVEKDHSPSVGIYAMAHLLEQHPTAMNTPIPLRVHETLDALDMFSFFLFHNEGAGEPYHLLVASPYANPAFVTYQSMCSAEWSSQRKRSLNMSYINLQNPVFSESYERCVPCSASSCDIRAEAVPNGSNVDLSLGVGNLGSYTLTKSLP